LDPSVVVPFILQAHVLTVAKEAGVGPSRETQAVADLTPGALAFLVAIIAYATPEEVAMPGRGGRISDASNTLGTKQMRDALINYKSLKTMNFDTSEDMIRRYIDELQCSALIEGGQSKFGGTKQFHGGRANDYQKVVYLLIICIIIRFY